MEYKIGDKVRIVKYDENIGGHRIGVVGIIISRASIRAEICWNIKDLKSNITFYNSEKELELVEKKEYKEGEKLECENCVEKFDAEYLKENTNGEIFCESCYKAKYTECDNCSEGVLKSFLREVNGENLCESCADEYNHCSECGGDFLNDSDEWENGNNGMCENCSGSDEDDESSERYYSKGDEYAGGHGRVYSVELEAYYNNNEDRQGLFTLPEAVGITHDGSLGSKGVELQTPKLNGIKGDKLLKQVCSHLNKNDFSVDKTCGLHIHLDTEDYFIVEPEIRKRIESDNSWIFKTSDRIKSIENQVERYTVKKIKNLLLVYLALETIIYSFLPMTRRTNRFCFPLADFYHTKEIENAESLEDLEKIWYREQSKDSIDKRKTAKYDDSRYAGFNFHSMFSNKHIEARHHSGTLDYKKIKFWLELNIAILDKTAEGKITGSELLKIKNLMKLSQKTDEMFKILELDEKTQAYFRARQSKFCEGDTEKQNICVE